ncbi:hypothetical protein KU43P_23150 [Pseudomonas sp. KU43P]|nr:hypothetical protein KU43P_23150 [Pseudomonas sp. KU43P]
MGVAVSRVRVGRLMAAFVTPGTVLLCTDCTAAMALASSLPTTAVFHFMTGSVGNPCNPPRPSDLCVIRRVSVREYRANGQTVMADRLEGAIVACLGNGYRPRAMP